MAEVITAVEELVGYRKGMTVWCVWGGQAQQRMPHTHSHAQEPGIVGWTHRNEHGPC
jgi:hypothetical protein